MKNILVPFDGSESALHAIQYAASMAKENPDIRLQLFHVGDPISEITQTSPSEEVIRQRQEMEANRILEPAKSILNNAGVQYEASYRVGSPANEIVDQVRKKRCEAVIMGTRGMGPIANVMIGSVATRVVHMTEVPVTLIK